MENGLTPAPPPASGEVEKQARELLTAELQGCPTLYPDPAHCVSVGCHVTSKDALRAISAALATTARGEGTVSTNSDVKAGRGDALTQEIPAGMVAWHGGDAAPEDWTLPIKYADGEISDRPPEYIHWQHSNPHCSPLNRIIAYTPRTARGEAATEEQAVYEARQLLASAYSAGAEAVHEAWERGYQSKEPDFVEAASDYAANTDLTCVDLRPLGYDVERLVRQHAAIGHALHVLVVESGGKAIPNASLTAAREGALSLLKEVGRTATPETADGGWEQMRETLNRIADLGSCANGKIPAHKLFQQAIDIATGAL